MLYDIKTTSIYIHVYYDHTAYGHILNKISKNIFYTVAYNTYIIDTHLHVFMFIYNMGQNHLL